MPLTFRTHSVKNANARNACSCGGHANHGDDDGDYSGRATPARVAEHTNAELPYSFNDELLRQGKMTQAQYDKSRAAQDASAAREAQGAALRPTLPHLTPPSIDTVDLSELLPPTTKVAP